MPDSPALSPIELKQELPKYLPALQVRRPPGRGPGFTLLLLDGAWGCSRVPAVL